MNITVFNYNDTKQEVLTGTRKQCCFTWLIHGYSGVKSIININGKELNNLNDNDYPEVLAVINPDDQRLDFDDYYLKDNIN